MKGVHTVQNAMVQCRKKKRQAQKWSVCTFCFICLTFHNYLLHCVKRVWRKLEFIVSNNSVSEKLITLPAHDWWQTSLPIFSGKASSSKTKSLQNTVSCRWIFTNFIYRVVPKGDSNACSQVLSFYISFIRISRDKISTSSTVSYYCSSFLVEVLVCMIYASFQWICTI